MGELGKTRAARLCLLGCRDGDEPLKPQQDSRSRGALSRLFGQFGEGGVGAAVSHRCPKT